VNFPFPSSPTLEVNLLTLNSPNAFSARPTLFPKASRIVSSKSKLGFVPDTTAID